MIVIIKAGMLQTKKEKNTMIRSNTVIEKIVLVFFMFVLSTISAVAEQESQVAESVRNFFTQTMRVTVTNLVEEPCISYRLIGLPYKEVKVDNSYFVWVADVGGTIYSYTKKDMPNEDVINKTQEDAISASEAFTSILTLLDYFELPKKESDYQMIFQDMGGETENDLDSCYWIIRRELNLDGIPCRMRSFVCFVSGASGTIFTFKYLPVIPPENTLIVTTTYAAARQAALNWLMESSVLSVREITLTGDENSGTQVVAPEENMFVDNMLQDQTEKTKTYYCWEVPFAWTQYEEDYNGYVWVNVETGEIVGAIGG